MAGQQSDLLSSPAGYGTFGPEWEDESAGDIKQLLEKENDDQKAVKVGYDDVLEEIGEFGSWQQWLAVLFWIPPAVSGAIFMLGSFTSKSSHILSCI